MFGNYSKFEREKSSEVSKMLSCNVLDVWQLLEYHKLKNIGHLGI